LIGAELVDAFKDRAKDFVNAAAQQGVMLLIAGPNVLRFAPSLIISDVELEEGFARLEKAIAQVVATAEQNAG
jgi:acetylornithine/N-succinyldiaminopimelate aminotransferase